MDEESEEEDDFLNMYDKVFKGKNNKRGNDIDIDEFEKEVEESQNIKKAKIEAKAEARAEAKALKSKYFRLDSLNNVEGNQPKPAKNSFVQKLKAKRQTKKN